VLELDELPRSQVRTLRSQFFLDDAMRKYRARMLTTAIAKIAASEKSITGPRFGTVPMTTKMQNITLKTSLFFAA
jgi:hypothetical protein